MIFSAPELFEVTKTSFNYKETSSSLSTVTSNELAMNISSHLSQHGNIGSEEFYTESRGKAYCNILLTL